MQKKAMLTQALARVKLNEENMLDLESLLNELELIDFKEQQELFDSNNKLDHLIASGDQVKVKMYLERNHPRPHFHIDYGKGNHSASFAIDTGKKLVGDLPNKYVKSIENWAADNRRQLLAIWDDLQSGKINPEFIEKLSSIH